MTDQPLSPSVQYGVGPIPYHIHNDIDSPKLDSSSIIGLSSVAGSSRGAASTTIGTGSDTKVQLDANNFADGITWDSTNNRFTVITAGYYLCAGTVTWQAVTDQKLYKTAIYKNGSVVAYTSTTASGTASVGPCVSIVLSLVANDYIELYCFQNSGGNQQIYTNAELTNLSICKV
jgi:hypothetical protein